MDWGSVGTWKLFLGFAPFLAWAGWELYATRRDARRAAATPPSAERARHPEG